MKIANGVEMLDLMANLSFGADLLHPTLLWDEETVILVDGGLPGFRPQIEEAMGKAGVPLEKLSKIIITHHDMDHIGGIPSLLKASSHPIEVLSQQPHPGGPDPRRRRAAAQLWRYHGHFHARAHARAHLPLPRNEQNTDSRGCSAGPGPRAGQASGAVHQRPFHGDGIAAQAGVLRHRSGDLLSQRPVRGKGLPAYC